MPSSIIPYKKLTREIALYLMKNMGNSGRTEGEVICAGLSVVCEDVGQAHEMPDSSLALFRTGMLYSDSVT